MPSSTKPAIFKGKVFFVTLCGGFSPESKLKNLIKEHGGTVTMQVTGKVDYVIVDPEHTTKDDLDKLAAKTSIHLLNCHIVSVAFVEGCIRDDKLLDHTDLIVRKKNDMPTPKYGSSTSSSSSSSSNSMGGSGRGGLLPSYNRQSKNVSLNFTDLIKKKKRKVRIFISSTFIDMVKEREYITKHLMPEINEYCKQSGKGLDFSFVDMRWGITTEESKKMNTIGTCLSEVDSSTYFISLLGGRYGWCEGDEYNKSFQLASVYHPWLKNYQGRSITELEILQATRFATQPKNVYFYFRDPKSTLNHHNSVQDSTEQQHHEPKESTDRLNRLKGIIKDHSLLNYTYNDINELLKKIVEDISSTIEKEMINESELILPFEMDKQVAYAQSLIKSFVPEPCNILIKVLNRVCATENPLKTSLMKKSEPIVIGGGSGSGKSTALSHWIHQLPSQPWFDKKKTLVIPIFIGVTSASRSRLEILRQTYSIIKSHYQISTALPENENDLLEEIQYWFDIATREDRKLIWILDGLQKIEVTEGRLFSEELMFLPTSLQTSVKMILVIDDSPQYIDFIHNRFFPNQPRRVLDHVDQLSTNSRKTLIDQTLSRYGKELENAQKDQLVRHAGSTSPFFITTVLSELISIGNFSNLHDKLNYLLSSKNGNQQQTTSLFTSIIQRWEEDPAYPNHLVSNILKLIYVSDVGLYESEILSILKLSSSYGFFASARPILTMDGSSNYIYFHNSSLREAVELKYFKQPQHQQATTSNNFKELLPHVHLNSDQLMTLLGEYFQNQNPASQRKVDILPRYLVKMDNKKLLKEFLVNVNNFSLLSTETGRMRMSEYWNFIGINKTEVIALYRTMFDQYRSSHPPLEDLAILARMVGLFFDNLSFYDAAFEFLDLAKEYFINLNGELHASVCQVLESLITVSIKQSKFDTSEHLSQKCLLISNSVYGNEQYGTIDSVILAGLVQKKKANYESSLNYYTTALNILYKFFGYSSSINVSDASLYFNSKLGELFNNLGDTYRKLSKLDQALEFYLKTLKIYKNIKVANHPSIAEVYKNLGLIEKKLGHYDEAISYYNMALNIIRTKYGSSHATCGLYLCDLADVYRKQDNYHESIDIYHQALAILMSQMGPKSIDVAEIYNNLGLIQKKLGEYQEAIKYYKMAIAISEETLGKNHPKTSFFNHNLGDCYRKLGQYKEAEVLFTKCLQSTISNLGNDHPEVAEILNSIGLVYKKQTKYLQAETEYKKAINIVIKSLGSDHYKVGVYNNNLADVYRKMKKYDMAKQLYNKALGIIEKSLGDKHTEYAEVLYGIGLLNLGLKDFDNAKTYIDRAIEITTEELGDEHPKIGIYMNSMAEVQIEKEKELELASGTAHKTPTSFDLDDTRIMYEVAYTILSKDLGVNHPEIADILVNRAELESKWGSEALFKQYMNQALEIIKNTFGVDHPKYQTISGRLLGM